MGADRGSGSQGMESQSVREGLEYCTRSNLLGDILRVSWEYLEREGGNGVLASEGLGGVLH